MDKDECTGIVSDFTKTCRNMQQAKCEDMVDLSLHSCEKSQTIGKTKTPSGTDNKDDFVDCTKNLADYVAESEATADPQEEEEDNLLQILLSVCIAGSGSSGTTLSHHDSAVVVAARSHHDGDARSQTEGGFH
jgi:hypothetical protein